jgi:hypothetical protein
MKVTFPQLESLFMKANTLPAPDRLAAIRARMKELQAEEQAIREQIVTGLADHTGFEYDAEIRNVDMFSVRAADLKKANPKLHAKLVKHQVVAQVWLHRRAA